MSATGASPCPGSERREHMGRFARLSHRGVSALAHTRTMDDETLRRVAALREMGAVEVELSRGDERLRVRFAEEPPEPGYYADLPDVPEMTPEERQAEAERVLYYSSRAGA